VPAQRIEKPPLHIVLSRTDRLGDLILSTPAIATLRRSFADARLTLVCSKYNAVVAGRATGVDDIVELPAETKHEIDLRRFDAVDLAIALAPRVLDMQIVAATQAPRRIGYTYARRYLTRALARRWLTDLLVSEADPDRADRDPSLVVRHEVDQVLALALAAGATDLAHELAVRIDDSDRAQAAVTPDGAIVIHIGKRWGECGSTPESLEQLFRDMRCLGRPLVATFGDDGTELAGKIAAACVADRVLGRLPFGVWAAVFERASCVVTIDTGATHVASAVKTPTVVLFESRYFRLNSQEWSPYRVPNAVLRKPRSEDRRALRASRTEIVEAVASLL
jgi:ADP-heptose:LPS heptosyltransferase